MKKWLTSITAVFALLMFVAPAHAASVPSYMEEPDWFEAVHAPAAL